MTLSTPETPQATSPTKPLPTPLGLMSGDVKHELREAIVAWKRARVKQVQTTSAFAARVC